MLYEMRKTLLSLVLVHASHVHLQVRFKALGRYFVGEDDIAQAVRLERTSVKVRVLRKRRFQKLGCVQLCALCRRTAAAATVCCESAKTARTEWFFEQAWVTLQVSSPGRSRAA